MYSLSIEKKIGLYNTNGSEAIKTDFLILIFCIALEYMRNHIFKLQFKKLTWYIFFQIKADQIVFSEVKFSCTHLITVKRKISSSCSANIHWSFFVPELPIHPSILADYISSILLETALKISVWIFFLVFVIHPLYNFFI